MKIKENINAALAQSKADLVLKNGNIINVFTEEIIKGDVAIKNGTIVGIGTYSGEKEVDCSGKYICPGFIDCHLHIESSMVAPLEFARAVSKSGTTTIIADPHEIVNVCGAMGLEYFLNATENLPINAYFMLPSSVPATKYETNGAPFTYQEMRGFLNHERVLGLGEVMCFTDVLKSEEEIVDKLVHMKAAKKKVDGHAPLLRGKRLQAYVTAGVQTDHECTTFDEASEKVRAGMTILIREGSAAKNLTALVTGLLKSNFPRDKFLFCTDDKHLGDIERDGHIRFNIQQAIKLGMLPITAIKMATINAARQYNLNNIGAIAPAYDADIVVLSDLKHMQVHAVYKNGVLINDKLCDATPYPVPPMLLNSVHCKEISKEDIALAVSGESDVIEMIPYQIGTKHIKCELASSNGFFVPDNVISKLCVVERHGKNGNIAVAPLKGYGIKNGAIATSVAHDSHNIIAAGDNDEDIVLCINTLRQTGGGYVLCSGGKVIDSLVLNIAGLMSEESAKAVQEKTSQILKKASQMGIPYYIDPFISLSFMALPVIPEIRLCDTGLYDVVNGKNI